MLTPEDALIAADRELAEAERWVSISRYALIYGVSRPTVYKWLKAGLLVRWQVARVLRVRQQPPKGA